MKYMTDAQLAGLAKELRNAGIECETVHKLLLGKEDSRVGISDPKIRKFLRDQKGSITLITFDSELAEHCAIDGIPCIRVQDLVVEHIQKSNTK